MKRKKVILSLFILMVPMSLFTVYGKNESNQQLKVPEFKNVSVHDPSIIEVDGTFYVIGSHMQFAKSNDLIQWEQLSNSVVDSTLFEDIRQELKDEFEFSHTDTLWATDIEQLKNGKFFMYYCLCQGSTPLSSLGLAISDSIEGPYKKVETFLHSGVSPQFGQDYDATKDPNVIDPHVFYDKEDRLWMVYGSYSGGIYIMEMNGDTGLPLNLESYGEKITGGNHSRIEAPYIFYNEKNDYYYLFTTFGGLDSFGGYNMRVSRSKKPTGPYLDILEQDMSNAMGKKGTVFDDVSIEPFGNKLMGNFSYEKNDGITNSGYVSPGHNSVYYDRDKDAYFLIFHTRFPNSGETHEVRVHQFFFTEEGWPIVVPCRYSNEVIEDYSDNEVIGNYNLIEFTKDISDEIVDPEIIDLAKTGQITGEYTTGDWSMSKNNVDRNSKITINNVEYFGKFIAVWDECQEQKVMSFTGVSREGIPLFLIENKEDTL